MFVLFLSLSLSLSLFVSLSLSLFLSLFMMLFLSLSMILFVSDQVSLFMSLFWTRQADTTRALFLTLFAGSAWPAVVTTVDPSGLAAR